MFKRAILFIFTVLVFLSAGIGVIYAQDFDVPAKSAIIVDVKTGQVLWEKNAHEKLPPASITKIMTLLLAMEAVERKEASLEDMVSVSAYAESMGGSQIYLSKKDRLPLSTMLKAVTMASANDACVASAEFIAGTEENFVRKMNERAKQLGMKDTQFKDTTGLPTPGHYTTAYDISIMAGYLIKYPQFREWAKTWHDVIQLVDGRRGLTNTNSLINTYPGLDGVKTGHTEEAGYCLAASAAQGDFRLVTVVMGTASEAERNAFTTRLLDYGFKAFEQRVIVEQNAPVENVPIRGGKKQTVNAYTLNSIKYVVMRGNPLETRKEIISLNKNAPVKKGEKVGELIIYTGDKEIGRTDLLAAEDVERSNIFVRIFRGFIGLFKRLFSLFK